MFQYRVINSYQEFEAYKESWEILLHKVNNTNPFLEFGWIAAWWQTIGQQKNIEIHAISYEQEIIGFAPFEKKEENNKHIAYSFIANEDASYMDILCEEHYKKDLLNFILDYLLKKNEKITVSLHGLFENSSTSLNLEWLLKKKAIVHDFTRVVAPYIAIRKEDQKDYFHKRRKLFALNRLEKSFESQGKVSFRKISVEEYEKMYELFDARWQMKNDTSGFSTDTKRQFHEKLNTETNLVQIEGLFLDEELVAFSFGFRVRSVYIGYSIAFNPEFECFGLGNILDKKIIEKSFEMEDAIFDFSIGFEAYKFNWATEIHYIRNYHFGNQASHKLVKKQNFKHMLIEQMKKNEKLIKFKRNTLGKWQYYLKNPLSVGKEFKYSVYFNKNTIYCLKANTLEKIVFQVEPVSLVKLKKMVKGKEYINHSFKEAKYFEVDNKYLYETNSKLIINDSWMSSIELPKNTVFIEGLVNKKHLAYWNDQDIYMVVNNFDIKKKNSIEAIGLHKVTTVHTMKFFKIQLFISNQLKLKSPKRYKFLDFNSGPKEKDGGR